MERRVALRLAFGVLLAGNAGSVGAQAPASGAEDPQALEQVVIVAAYGATAIDARPRPVLRAECSGWNRSSARNPSTSRIF